MLTSNEAADRLGLTTGRIRQLARAGVLAGERRGRDWFVDAESVDLYSRRKVRKKKGTRGE